jgi:hypothetical protein
MHFAVENQINRKLLVAARLNQSVLNHVVVEACKLPLGIG